jgi:hypothetical protein
MIDYPAILTHHYAGSEWTLNGDEYSGLTWLSDTPKPTQEELDALWDETLEMIEAEKQAKVDARQSALDKLAALGLNEDEVRAIIG